MGIRHFEDIIAWQKARELVRRIYQVTAASEGFRRDRGLRDQVQRSAVSSMSNIAEGFGRGSDRQFANFLDIARGSIAEVQSQLYVAIDLGYMDEAAFEECYDLADQVSRLLMQFRRYLLQEKT